MRMWLVCGLGALLLCSGARLFGQAGQEIALGAADKLELHNVKAEKVNYQGRAAMRVTDAAAADTDDAERLAIIPGTSLQDGTIEVSLSGDTLANAAAQARGFVGIAFRVSGNGSHFECFYLRPKNGRAEDQLQRNHSTQYVSVPGYPWNKLREESPGKYESYVDLVAGQWTKVKIEVSGTKARLYVNGSEQPVLIVNDLKQAPMKGGIALWVGPGTVAHFLGLKVSQ